MTAVAEIVADYGPLVGLVGVAATLAVNGHRDERQRRSDNHARAIEAVVAYSEMPFRIRRRRNEPDQASGERTRLSDAFSEVQAELASCQTIIRADTDPGVREAYERLVATLRETAGRLTRDAWSTAPVADDEAMNMPDVYHGLGPVRTEQARCEAVMAASTHRFARARRLGA